MNKPVAYQYVTEVCNRYEETFYTKDRYEEMVREKVLEINPLYKEKVNGNRFEVWVDDPKEGWYLEGTYDSEEKAYFVSEDFVYSYVEEI